MDDYADFFTAVTAIGQLEDLDIEAMRLLFRIECSGEDFYNCIADRIGNPAAAELLRKNAREERAHAERLRRAIGIKLGRDYQPSDADLKRYPVPLPDSIPVELLPVIVKGEFDGDVGYQKWAERESDAEIQRLLRQNGREETVHGERVNQVIQILTSAPDVA
jgi:rubrerythrin